MMKFDYPHGATPLDQDELAALIPDHIVTQEQLNAWESRNILAGETWALRKKEILSMTFIKDLHEHMFGETWKWAGKFRKTEKNIGIHWPQIPMKVKELCDDVQYQLDHDTYSQDEIAVRLHHRLVFIHPFPNGNGRHARLMADLLIIKLGGKRFSWGMHQDLVNHTSTRKQYIKALQCADRGNYAPLVLFARS